MARKKTSTSKADKTSEADNAQTPEVEESAAAQEPASDQEHMAEDAAAPADEQAETPDADASEEPAPGEEATDAEAEAAETSDSPEPPDEIAEGEVLDPDAQDTPKAIEDPGAPDMSSDDGGTDETTSAIAPLPVATEPEPQRGNGFVPMLLGGVLAAALGFVAAYLALPRAASDDTLRAELTSQLDAQSKDIAGLTETVGALPAAPDLSSVEDGLSDMTASLDAVITRLEGVETRLSDLDQRLTDVEKRPISEGASDAAVAAYERELKALQDAMAAQRAEIEEMTAEAQSLESSAEETARATMRRAALTRIQTALDTGVGFAPALGELETAGVDVPPALANVSEAGVPSIAQLQDSFPDAARAALTAARRDAAESGEQGGFATFLRNQLGTRSLEPREGDDPDAVLSRAEAAIREGRLADTLAEIETLPEKGRAELADWSTQAALRLDAVAAAEALSQELN